ncbi:MAG: type II toxin-antitoxin system PemK/MazF family toxin [Planctomycetes bacterium]|nr:type II toxin-antitoxin system PemK/MazF family toxin [Planctomycetota bacterium]
MGAGSPERGEVWLTPFPMPSRDQAQSKLRPVLVVSAATPEQTNGTVTCAAISSSTYRLTDFDIPVAAQTRLGHAMGMRRDGAIFCAILQTTSVAQLLRKIGSIDAHTQVRVDANLKKLLFPVSAPQ